MVIFRADPNIKEVALIFDDGPNPKVTPKLLNVLKDRQVHANFFLIGARSEESPEAARLIAQDGHEIGNHTYTHKHLTQILKNEGEVAVKKEIEQGASAIEKAADIKGSDIRFLRPPYLDWSDEVAKIAFPMYGHRIMMSHLAVGDYDWGDNHYWDDNDKKAIDAQAARIVQAWRGAPAGTLLSFHDSSEHKLPGNKDYETWMNRALPTLEAIPRIIDDLISRGFAIKRLSEMKLLVEEDRRD
ncbi:MAG TPA: polysaccharide deacetylase family protein [Candidatus Saccharimonadales bacterium]|nr:polysaccharide deacetylase family protein [Candidatus Saccharimonadales bacterium]